MIKKLLITRSSTVIFKGNPMNMPVKKDAIIEESIALFDDDDPCVIHTSFVVQKFVEKLDGLFEKAQSDEIDAQTYDDDLAFLDLDVLDDVTLKKVK